MQASRSSPHLRDLIQHLNRKLSKTPEVEKRGPQRVKDCTSPSAGELKELPRLEGMFLLSAYQKGTEEENHLSWETEMHLPGPKEFILAQRQKMRSTVRRRVLEWPGAGRDDVGV